MRRNCLKVFRVHNRLQTMVRHSIRASELWTAFPWKQFRKNLYKLQKRVYKAVQRGDKRMARSLQKLILKSQGARLLAIRQVTQLNAGRKTAGIDRKACLTCAERLALADTLARYHSNWKHQGLRSIPIPKKDGSQRILRVPTLADRAWQCLAKYALEPAHEATFQGRSYGFRPGRCAQDAQKVLFLQLNQRCKGFQKRVIELDIERCFERISHRSILDNLIAPSGLKLGIFRCLKAGTQVGFPEQGTPQGGVVSPLLANIALNGIESIHPSVRYADDMVVILKPQDDEDAILAQIQNFLDQRGMQLNASKTQITATTDGFNFLGWQFKCQHNGKFVSRPSAANFHAFRQKAKAIVNSSHFGATAKAQKLALIVRGWRNYHKHGTMQGARDSLWFLRLRTFRVFRQEPSQTWASCCRLIQQAFPSVSYSANRYVNVRGNKSPFDGDLLYWSQRNSKFYGGLKAKALKRQHQSCHVCGLRFIGEENIHLHHGDGHHNNWTTTNLVAVHESCHDSLHRSKRER